MGDLSRWEINPYRPVIGLFHTMTTANQAGKEALKQMLDKLFV
jgi:hypothetical protein